MRQYSFASVLAIAIFIAVVDVPFLLYACGPNLQSDMAAVSTISDANALPGKAGVGPNLNKRKLTAEVVRKKVRKGGLVMASFSEKRISNKELERLAEFVPTLNRKK